ncbi:uncharacterized protein [Panulirus ornatus]|uniref:uncharacterized protein n=1 Tax=Panulirus ornatus TaxID=150431 RepID=UPI003A84440F
MGWARVAVAGVLSLISLTVLSLHVALCVHYPSPLFAVTLLLNPSLWMFLGAAGMGCALALTYRERQRKVRAGLCASCHTRYGATLDSKWRIPEAQWRDGPRGAQRGPSRAIYSYNGTSHKFYASYGTINEKQPVDLKRPALLKTVSKTQVTETKNQRDLPSPNSKEKSPVKQQQIDAQSAASETVHHDEGKHSQEQTHDIQERQEQNNDGEDPLPKSHEDVTVMENDGSPPGLSQGGTKSGEVTQSPGSRDLKTQSEKKNSSIRSLSESPLKPPVTDDPPLDTHKGNEESRVATRDERLTCDCVARYAAMDYNRRRLYTTAGDGRLPRRHQYSRSQVRSLGRYHKLLMHCKLRDPKDVPVELFAARSRSTEDPSSTAQSDASHGVLPSRSGEDAALPLNPTDIDATKSRGGCLKLQEDDPEIQSHNRRGQVGSDTNSMDVDKTGSANSESIASTRLFTIGKVKDSHYPPTTQLLPVKHSPPSPIYKPILGQWSTASPPAAAPSDNSPNQHPSQELSHDSSQNPIQEPTQDSGQSPEAQSQDLDVASVSSESGLLPSCSKSSSVGRDFLKSPLWRSFRGGKKDQKVSAGDDDDHSEDAKSQHCDGEEPESTRSQQRLGQQRLRSLFSSSRRAFTRPRRTRPSGASERRTPWRTSPASPSVSTSTRDSLDSASPPRDKRCPPATSSVRKSKLVPSSFSRKNPNTATSTPPSSPARAVRSLVMRNIHKTTGRSREARRRLPQAEATTAAGRLDGTSDSGATQEATTVPLSPLPSSTSTSPSPSVRPKERKKTRTRLRGRYRAGSTESAMLLSDDTGE